MKIAIASCRELPEWEVDDRPLVEALEGLGVEVSVVAWDSPVEWERFDGVLLRTTWDYADRIGEFLEWIDDVASRTTLLNPAGVVRWNLDKRYLRDLEEAGVPIAPTVWLEAGSKVELATLLDERGWNRGFLKPVVGASARATRRFRRDEVGGAQQWLDPIVAVEGMMLQPYLESVEGEGEVSAICVEGVARHWVRKVPVPGDYRVQDDYGASDEPWGPDEAARRLAEATLEAAKRWHKAPLVQARVDLLRDQRGRWVLNELELVEPSLFFRHGVETAVKLAEAVVGKLRG